MKTGLIWILLVAVVVIALVRRDRDRDRSEEDIAPVGSMSAEDSLKHIDDRNVIAWKMQREGLVIFMNDGQPYTVIPANDGRVMQRLQQARVPVMPSRRTFDDDANGWWWVLGLAVAVLAVLYFLKKRQGGMNNIFEMRKTKARQIDSENKAHFADIGGNKEAVELLADIVDFLRAPKRWTAAGSRIPRGILVVGPPGTGKTLLARAVAGETQSAFFYTSASEFVEMFVGVGAARVRDTFEKAAANQPSVIFIDELDAIGRRRGSGFGTMHEEREHTLNQLLVLMDGLERHERVVVMAATNRPDVLDPALMRSGRFDRLLRLKSPTQAERADILKIHTRAKPLDANVSLEQIAGRTEGFTGADLEALTNEAALLAVRRNRGDAQSNGNVTLTSADFDQALSKMTKSNRQFDRLDMMLVESVSQFTEPVGRAVARVTLTTGTVVEGEVVWMNSAHIKLRGADGAEVIIAKEMAEKIIPLAGTESARGGEFIPDRWAGQNVDAG